MEEKKTAPKSKKAYPTLKEPREVTVEKELEKESEEKRLARE